MAEQEQQNQQAVRTLAEVFSNFEFRKAAAVLADDFICDWPQSRERMTKENYIAMNENYPGRWRISILKIVASGDEVVTESLLTYDEEIVRAVSFYTLRDGKIMALREFFPTDYAAPDWRAQWVERY